MTRLKTILGLGLIATAATGALGGNAATATTSGHFTSDAPSGKTEAVLTTQTGGTHILRLETFAGLGTCHQVAYSGSMTGSTTQSIRALATFSNCTIGEEQPAVVTMNGCETEFFSRNISSLHATVKLVCPAGKRAEMHQSSCTQTFAGQTLAGGVVFTTITVNGKHAITADLTGTNLHYELHGLCALFGTTHTDGLIEGAATVHGIDAASKAFVNITAT